MLALAAYYIETDQPDQAAALLSDSVTRANAIANKTSRASRLTAIALAYNQIKRLELANQLIAQSQDLLNQAARRFPFQPHPLQGTFGFSASASIFDTTTALLGFNGNSINNGRLVTSRLMAISRWILITVNQLRPGGYIALNYRRHTNRKWQYFADLLVQLNNGFLSSSLDHSDTSSSGVLVAGKSLNLWRGKSPQQFLDLQIGVGASYVSDNLQSDNLSVRKSLSKSCCLLVAPSFDRQGQDRSNPDFSSGGG